MRIISAYGDGLSAEAWLISMRSVIFKLLSSIETELRAVQTGSAKEKQREDWKDTAIVVISGISHLCASYLHVLTAHETFTSVWKELLGHFATMLDFNILDVSAATFSAVRDILKQTSDKDQQGFTKEMIDLTWELWSRDVPVVKDTRSNTSSDNQKCLLVWVEALIELYRLIEQGLDVERVRRMLTLLREAMQYATPGPYTSDVDYVTPLQGRILDVCKTVRTDVPGVPSAMISQVAEFVSLAFVQKDTSSPSAQKRTYVAMSKESMAILQSLITKNAAETDIYRTDAFASALEALQRPIDLKYSFPIRPKSVQPWREATKCFLEVLAVTLPHIRAADVPRATFQNIWHIIVATARSMMTAEWHRAPSGSNIFEDEDFDITSFRTLRPLIIPSLGAESVPDKTRKAYVQALFHTSIIHEPAPGEILAIDSSNGGDVAALSALYKPRAGRTVDPTPTKRVRMSYVCLEELFALVGEYDEESADPRIAVQPPTPGLPRRASQTASDPKEGQSDRTVASSEMADTTHQLHIRLARTAAPYLILRCALSMRAYIADQPLRGRMPQPLSQRKELTTLLRCLVDLRSKPEAIRDAENVDSDSRKHLFRLYPLLVAAVQVAGSSGDDKVLGLVREALDVVGGELGVLS
jgi:hypothetical protein